MFERAAIFSALLLLTFFSIASLKFLQFTGLETESPVEVIQEIFPPIDTSDE